MKKLTFVILLTAALAGCRSNKEAYELPERTYPVSWVLFCKERGYKVADNRAEIVDEYLDTWLGSTEEEVALLSIGIES